MIDTLSGFNKQTGDVYISIVPFAKDVNVGTTNVGASWINWTDWEAEPPILVNNKSNSLQARPWAGSNCPFTNSQSRLYLYGPARNDERGNASVSKIPSERHLCGLDLPKRGQRQQTPRQDQHLLQRMLHDRHRLKRNLRIRTRLAPATGTGSSTICHLWRGNGHSRLNSVAAAPAHSTWTGCINDRDQSYDTTEHRTGISSGGKPVHAVLCRTVGGLPSRHGDADEQSVANPQGSDQRHDPERQYQPGGGTGMGLAVPEHDQCADRSTGEGRQLRL